MKRKYPLISMEVGEAFDVAFGDVAYASLRSYMSSQAKKLGIELRIRSVPEARVWEVSRVAPVPDRVYVPRRGPVQQLTRAERAVEISRIRRELDEL